jgi:hypothetical protein
MPSVSPAQARLMAMIAHGGKPTGMNGPGPPVSVAKEFNAADAKTGILRKKKKKNNPHVTRGGEPEGYR